MKKEVKQLSVTGLVVSILEILLGLISFLVGVCGHIAWYGSYTNAFITFGADFYTDIYEATAHAANNVYYLIYTVCVFANWFFSIIGILIILVAVKNLVTAIKGEKPRPVYMIESNNETNKQE